MPRRLRQLLIGASIFAFFLLHDDFWLAAEPRLVLGLPAGLLYHALYCVAASVLMAALVRVAWPLGRGAGGNRP
jgi:Protein of unknown function (DUF3311)